MSKARVLFIENWLGKSPRKLVNEGNQGQLVDIGERVSEI